MTKNSKIKLYLYSIVLIVILLAFMAIMSAAATPH
jgi:hypothetical protein